ncbi:MAG: class I SAM-dependent methyltransferase, partial [Acidimicrobiia bacterium]|nr:class I SAM-dependent methyltransferase [Acidimicrobiia bacterium]
LFSNLVARAGRSGRGRRMVDAVLDNEEARDLILHRLGTRQIHDSTTIDELLPNVEPDHDFAHLLWLLSSNYANRGMAMLMLEEAVWLYDAVKDLGEPSVVELGRAKGGTTFFLAASGAKVISIDNGALERRNNTNFGPADLSYDESLHHALVRAGLRDRVELVTGDAETCSVPETTVDLVFSDVVLPTNRMIRLFDRWWEVLKPGGFFVLRDGREPRTPSVRGLVEHLQSGTETRFLENPPGVFSVLIHP